MSAEEAYRLYALALYLNKLEEHNKNEGYCRTVMTRIAEMGGLSPEVTERIYEEVVREVNESFKNLEAVKLPHKSQ